MTEYIVSLDGLPSNSPATSSIKSAKGDREGTIAPRTTVSCVVCVVCEDCELAPAPPPPRALSTLTVRIVIGSSSDSLENEESVRSCS